MSDTGVRCSAVVVLPIDHMKRCIRNDGHSEAHTWVEAENPSDRLPILIRWDLSGVRYFEYQRVYNR